MKLDKIGFARLIAWISPKLKFHLEMSDIMELDAIIDLPSAVVASATSPDRLNDLLLLMKDGTRKIEAIRVYRDLTGCVLKESKDAVEAYWVSKNDA